MKAIAGVVKTLAALAMRNGVERQMLQRGRREASRNLERALAALEAHADRTAPTEHPDASEPPVFVLSAGWRSGSTLLQRLLSSSGEILLWGEPWDRCECVQSLARTLRPVTEQWPPSGHLAGDPAKRALASEWIANLYPDPEELRAAHRAFFERLFADPATRAGFRRWGLKEVRLGSAEIAYLRWLFPEARFVLLVRNPHHAWESYRGRYWFMHWPDRPVSTAASFARVWDALASQFLDQCADDVLHVPYEALRAGSNVLEALESHVGMELDRSVLANRIAGPAGRPADEGLIRKTEHGVIAWLTRDTRRRLGYS